MYLAWLLLQGMASEELAEDAEEDLQALRERRTTPGLFLLQCSDGKFVDDLVSDEANTFTASYYDLENGQYVEDYEEQLGPRSFRCTTSPILGKTSTDWHR